VSVSENENGHDALFGKTPLVHLIFFVFLFLRSVEIERVGGKGESGLDCYSIDFPLRGEL
jgi:hypothetical protein